MGVPVGPAVALLVTPALGGLVADLLSLRAIFFVGAGLTVIAVGFYSTITPRPVKRHSGPPITYRSTLRQRSILLICLLEMATLFTLTLGVTLAPNFLQDVHGVGTGTIGVLGSISAAGSIGLFVIISRVQRFHQPLLAIALSIAAVGGSLALLVVGQSLPLYALSYLLRGGYTVAWSLFAAALGDIASDRFRGRAFALGEIMGGAGYAFAPFAAGWLYEIKPVTPLIVGVIMVVPLVFGAQWINRVVREATPVLIEEPV